MRIDIFDISIFVCISKRSTARYVNKIEKCLWNRLYNIPKMIDQEFLIDLLAIVVQQKRYIIMNLSNRNVTLKIFDRAAKHFAKT